MSKGANGLVERLARGERVLVAEGYIFELERRGYLRAGAYVPEVILEHPDVVKGLYEEFVHAGSDVVVALQYYAHRDKLRLVGREGDLEHLNMTALGLARQVANTTDTLMAGNLCNTTVYQRHDPTALEKSRKIFEEQLEWAVKQGADYIVAETFSEVGEALLALEVINSHGNGLPAAVSLSAHEDEVTFDKVPYPVACRQLEEAGAAVVGLNCTRGPRQMLRIMKEIRRACKGPIMALPVPYRTTDKEPSMQTLTNPETGKRVFPVDLPALACFRTDIVEFAREAQELGVQYLGLCCGNASHYMRVLAEECGRKPPASRFSPNMKEHYTWGDSARNSPYYTQGLREAILRASTE